MTVRILRGDVRDRLRDLPDESVHCVVTSPPYWGLRDYGVAGQIGLEETPDAFVAELVAVFREVRRVLRADGTAWVNLGDSYASGGGTVQPHRNTSGGFGGSDGERTQGYARAGGGFVRPASDIPAKNLVGIPWRVAFALQADGWYLRQDIIWHKPNPMPESVTDRCTKSHEYIFLLSKAERYYYDQEAILEPVAPASLERWAQDIESQEASARVPGKTNGKMKAVGRGTQSWSAGSSTGNPQRDNSGGVSGPVTERNKRSVWTVTTRPFKEAHFATFPTALIEPCILAGCPPGGTVLDPFGGAGTTGVVAQRLERNAILIELNSEYADMAERRIRAQTLPLPLTGS